VRDFEFWTVKKNPDAQLCVIHETACVVYASSMRDYARDTRRLSVLMRQNWFETAHVYLHPLTTHLRITFIAEQSACTWNVREACVFGRAPSVIHASGVRRMFVEYCTVFARCVDVRDISVIRQLLKKIRARFMRDSSVISTPDTPKI